MADIEADPYYLNPSDNPGAILVSQILQDSGGNYGSWCRAMRIALGAKDKLGFVTGSIAKPAEDSPDLPKWLCSNDMTTSWILNSISKDHHTSVRYADSAADIWNDLKHRFQQSNGPRVYELKKEMLNCTQGSLSDCDCGGSYLRKEQVMNFLMGLSDTFSNVRGNILLQEPIPDINQAYSLVLQDEKKRQISNSAEPSQVAFAVSTTNKSGKRDRPQCSYCSMLGHTKEKCFKLHGYPLVSRKRSPLLPHHKCFRSLQTQVLVLLQSILSNTNN